MKSGTGTKCLKMVHGTKWHMVGSAQKCGGPSSPSSYKVIEIK